MELESLLLQLEFSVRSANFKLFAVTLKKIGPLTVTLNAMPFSRSLPMFVRDLEKFQKCILTLYSEFLGGKFTSNKTKSAFSAIFDDKFHEQNKKRIKGKRGDKEF
ncbi:hypothetical protein AVEN_40480-1 [Araneus ventricosus]|uniref:Uncharacterized protein n=1 Tax=Araneus ventricosus TaxID=182803 RepID=A0A4Y2LWE4_ARAVE|nr:hypothetical protein AVEN_40480-1 [Araneus ventricosus]